jgi:hypothetical protein
LLYYREIVFVRFHCAASAAYRDKVYTCIKWNLTLKVKILTPQLTRNVVEK